MAEEKVIDKVNFNSTVLEDRYYRCVFNSCDFSNMTIKNVNFEDCKFCQCNFSLTKLFNFLSKVKFIECKMTGTDFTGIGKFSDSLYFEGSQLNYATFFGLKLRDCRFTGCNLNEVSFEESNITSTVFDNCDLMRATFFNTNLENVDFSTSYNFSINPTINKLKKAIFSENELRGLVEHLNIIIKES